MTDEKITEIEVIAQIDKLLSELNDKDTNKRVIRWAAEKYAPSIAAELELSEKKATKPKAKKRKTILGGNNKRKGNKLTLGIVKELNLRPKRKKAFVDFAGEKEPKNHKEKMTLNA